MPFMVLTLPPPRPNQVYVKCSPSILVSMSFFLYATWTNHNFPLSFICLHQWKDYHDERQQFLRQISWQKNQSNCNLHANVNEEMVYSYIWLPEHTVIWKLSSDGCSITLYFRHPYKGKFTHTILMVKCYQAALTSKPQKGLMCVSPAIS